MEVREGRKMRRKGREEGGCERWGREGFCPLMIYILKFGGAVVMSSLLPFIVLRCFPYCRFIIFSYGLIIDTQKLINK